MPYHKGYIQKIINLGKRIRNGNKKKTNYNIKARGEVPEGADTTTSSKRRKTLPNF